MVIHWKLSEPQVHFISLAVHVAQTFSLVCSRVLQWRLGGQMDMEGKLDTTWQQLLWWRQDARLRSFQRWALKFNSIWHCIVSVRTSVVHGRCLELLNVLLSCNMHVKMLMRNEFFNVTVYGYLFSGSLSLYGCLYLHCGCKMAETSEEKRCLLIKFSSLWKENSASKLDIPCSWFCIMQWKRLLDFSKIMQRFITEIFLANWVCKNLWDRHIPKTLTYIYLLKCGRGASSLRKGKVLNIDIKVILEDFCIKVPLTHWQLIICLVLLRIVEEVISNCPLKRKVIEIRLVSLCHEHVERTT